MAMKWCKNTGVTMPSTEEGYMRQYICSLHFERKCFGNVRLKKWAVPTLKLGTNQHGSENTIIYQNPVEKIVYAKGWCSLEFCGEKRSMNSQLSLHHFPRDNILYRKWCYNLHLDPLKNYHKYRICSLHFTRSCFGKRNLVKTAVPTLNLGHNDTINIYRNNALKKRKIRNITINREGTFTFTGTGQAQIDKCLIPSCGKTRLTSENISFHVLPSCPERLRKWSHNLKMDLKGFTAQARICSTHFESICLGQRCLKRFAVPTLRLGHNDTNIYQNCESSSRSKSVYDTERDYQGMGNCEEDVTAQYNSFHSNSNFIPPNYSTNQNSSVNGQNLTIFARNCGVRLANNHMDENYIKAWDQYTRNTMYNNLSNNEIEDNSVEDNSTSNSKRELCCALTHCRKTFANGVRLLNFPGNNDRQTQMKWCHNLQMPIYGCSVKRICSDHFEKEFLDNRHLYRAAPVPTLNLNLPVDYKIYQNNYSKKTVINETNTPNTMQNIVGRTNVRYCLVANCMKTVADGVHLFRLPLSQRELFNVWRDNLKVLPQNKPLTSLRLCSDHFERHLVKHRRLVPGAIPTLNLSYRPLQKTVILSVMKCVVKSCPTIYTRRSRRDFYLFPKFPGLRFKWCYNIKMDPNECTEKTVICGAHFEAECKGAKGRLHKWAIPTLNLDSILDNAMNSPDNKHDLILNPSPIHRSIKSIEKCLVPTCGKCCKYDGVSLYSFPKQKHSFRRWKAKLQLDYLIYQKCKRYKICGDHFDSKHIQHTPNRLSLGAVPTLGLHYIPYLSFMRNQQMTRDVRTAKVKTECLFINCRGEELITFESLQNDYLKDIWNQIIQQESSKECEEVGDLENNEQLCGNHFKIIYEKFLSYLHSTNLLTMNTINNDKMQALRIELEALAAIYQQLSKTANIIQIKTEKIDPDMDEENGGIQLGKRRVCTLPLKKLKVRVKRLKLCHDSSADAIELPDCTEPIDLTESTEIEDDYTLASNRSRLSCCLPYCNNYQVYNKLLALFALPNQPDLRQKWCDNLALEPSQCNGPICINHFDLTALSCGRLKADAVPTINLLDSKLPIHEYPKN